jgi:protein-tyrosine phosphatase
MSKITDSIYLGDVNNSQDEEFIKSKKIKTVITIAPSNEAPFPKENEYGVDRYRFSLQDRYNVDMYSYMDKVSDLIFKSVAVGNVLIHCVFGVCRSPTMLAAYFIKYRNMPYKKAIEFISVKRSIDISPAFVKQLERFYLEKVKKECISNEEE